LPISASRLRGQEILGEVSRAVDDWRKTGRGIGMTDGELEAFADAFEHRECDAARKLL
jgi:hypothetical protein